tara:strand:+ start:1203 stop:1871 length:669 start_codon:yes stop_codon:yes gene_type:complete
MHPAFSRDELENSYDSLLKQISKDLPRFEVKSKRDSLLFKILPYITFYNREISTRYITTLYPYVYVPSIPWNPDLPLSRLAIMAHEYVHLMDRKRLGPIFNFLYLSPQILSLLAINATFFSNWFLLFLLFLLPIPSPGRAWLEYRGYRMTLAVWFWTTGKVPEADLVLKHFTGSGYYWMWPFEKMLKRKFERDIARIQLGIVPEELLKVKKILDEEHGKLNT